MSLKAGGNCTTVYKHTVSETILRGSVQTTHRSWCDGDELRLLLRERLSWRRHNAFAGWRLFWLTIPTVSLCIHGGRSSGRPVGWCILEVGTRLDIEHNDYNMPHTVCMLKKPSVSGRRCRR